MIFREVSRASGRLKKLAQDVNQIVFTIIAVVGLICCLPQVGYTVADSDLSESDYNRVSKQLALLVVHEDYEAAIAIADSVMQALPGHPYGPLLKATVLNSRSIDFEDNLDIAELKRLCDQVDLQVGEILSHQAPTARLYFFQGIILTYRVMAVGNSESRYRALKYGLRALEYFEDAVALDSTFWDAYYGLGMIMYFKSEKAGILRSIGLVADNRSEGKEYVELAAARGSLAALPAQNSLAWMSFLSGDYDSAEKYCDRLLEQYPGRRSFFWCKAKIEKEKCEWADAIVTYQQLLAMIKSQTRNNHYNEIGILHSLALSNYNLERWEEVVKYADEAFAIEAKPEIVDRKKKDFQNLTRMRRKAQKMIENN